MGFLNLFKKKKKENENTIVFNVHVGKGLNSTKNNIDFEHLTAEGELPFGWVFHNREFTEKIGGEYSYFLNMWLDARNKTPKELYSALKSFVLYLEDAEKLCKSKGECFEFWYYEILTSHDYLEKRKQELNKLTVKFDELQKIYEKKQNLESVVITLLKENDGILQSEFKKLFDDPFQNDVSDILYHLHQAGKIERIKSGRSYILHCKTN